MSRLHRVKQNSKPPQHETNTKLARVTQNADRFCWEQKYPHAQTPELHYLSFLERLGICPLNECYSFSPFNQFYTFWPINEFYSFCPLNEFYSFCPLNDFCSLLPTHCGAEVQTSFRHSVVWFNLCVFPWVFFFYVAGSLAFCILLLHGWSAGPVHPYFNRILRTVRRRIPVSKCMSVRGRELVRKWSQSVSQSASKWVSQRVSGWVSEWTSGWFSQWVSELVSQWLVSESVSDLWVNQLVTASVSDVTSQESVRLYINNRKTGCACTGRLYKIQNKRN